MLAQLPTKENAVRHIDGAVNTIQRALRRVVRDHLTPATLSPEFPCYCAALTNRYPDDGSAFSQFVLSLPYAAIHAELLRHVIPENLRQKVHDCRAEYDALQIRKDKDLARGDYYAAARCRDEQQVIARTIRELLAGEELLITPALIESALMSLGYRGP